MNFQNSCNRVRYASAHLSYPNLAPSIPRSRDWLDMLASLISLIEPHGPSVEEGRADSLVFTRLDCSRVKPCQPFNSPRLFVGFPPATPCWNDWPLHCSQRANTTNKMSKVTRPRHNSIQRQNKSKQKPSVPSSGRAGLTKRHKKRVLAEDLSRRGVA
jgi:hypothetical protein